MPSKAIVFAERVLPSTQTFIPSQIDQFRDFAPVYTGLLPAHRSIELNQRPVLLRTDRSPLSRVARELYRWTGVGPRFHNHLRKAGAALIHAHFAEGGPPALFLSKKLNLPLVLHLHGGAELMTDANLRGKWYEWPFLAHRRNLWRRASAFLCVSKYVYDCALRAGFPATKLQVHFTGLDCDAFTPHASISEKDPGLILYIGRLIEYKGCADLIRAMQLVQQRCASARLVMIGEGTCRKDLEQLARSLEINCQFLGELKPAGVRSWLEKARVLCGPSITLPDGQSEAFGMVFLEAQAMGVPVVGYRHGGIPETMLEGVTGLLADERDITALAGYLVRYIVDDTFWRHSRQEGMRWVRSNFDHRVQAAKLESIYHRIVNGFRPDSFDQLIQGA